MLWLINRVVFRRSDSKEPIPHAKMILGVDISQGAAEMFNKRFIEQGFAHEAIHAIRKAVNSILLRRVSPPFRPPLPSFYLTEFLVFNGTPQFCLSNIHDVSPRHSSWVGVLFIADLLKPMTPYKVPSSFLATPEGFDAQLWL